MAYLRCIKNKEVLNSDERTEYLKDKTIFLNARNSSSNNIVFKNNNGCLKSTNSYEIKYNIAKGHNLVVTDCSFQTNSLTPTILGNMNEANFILAKMPIGNSIIHSETNSIGLAATSGSITGPLYDNMNNRLGEFDPLEPNDNDGVFGVDGFAKWDGSGVLIDGNRIFVNKKICGPLVYLKDPSNNPYYDLSLNDGSATDYINMVRNNTRLTNFRLNQSINLKPYNFK